MKKLNLALLATTLCAAGATTSVFAAGGRITINGRVSATTCTLMANGMAGKGMQNVIVTLPTVPTSVFWTENSTSQATNFNLALMSSTGASRCDEATVNGLQGITLGGPTNANQYVSDSTTQLVNTVLGSTINVQLKLASETSPIDFALTNQLTSSNGNNGIWNMQAQYFSPSAAPAAQNVSSAVSYILNYN